MSERRSGKGFAAELNIVLPPRARKRDRGNSKRVGVPSFPSATSRRDGIVRQARTGTVPGR
jgi:hypothetical protein